MTKLSFLFGLAMAGTKKIAAADCIARSQAAPPTVYEAEAMSPQNMDYDRRNKMFIAHSGWYNDKMVNYYKFRIFAPSTYPGIIKPGSSSKDVPIQKIYIPTTDGAFAGGIGNPVIDYHHADGTSYSDFMEVNFVTVPEDYEANTLKSNEDILASGYATEESGIILNIPIVPTGSTLQDPEMKGTAKAPIESVKVWYKCIEVWTYVFEVNDELAADFFAFTRPEDPLDFAYAIPVVDFANKNSVNAIPLWHVNQFSRGVAEGENGGGPSPAGMKNIINLDRPDLGYSPLWNILWATALPVNYLADQVSNPSDMTTEDGFDFVVTPMFVNCPDIGNIGTAVNPSLVSTHQTEIDPNLKSNWLIGGDISLIFKPDEPVSFQTQAGSEVASAETNMMGAYEYELMSSDIPEGTTEIKVIANDVVIRTISVLEKADMTADTAAVGKISPSNAAVGAILASLMFTA